ncbi:MAG: transposase, partial [Nanoarchaeota archaeon]
KKNPALFTGNPKIPKYRDKQGYGICIFTSQQVRIKEGYIHFPKHTDIQPVKTKVEKLQQVRIIPQATCFIIEVVYNKNPTIYEIDKSKFLSIDLGVNNIATSINNVGEKPFIINGRVLKSKNQWYNKHKAKLMAYVGNKGTSNRIEQLTFKRNNYIEDKLHKISRFIVNYCIDHEIGTIIIGKNPLWKQKINTGKRNNQNFVSLPHARLIQKITYKAEMAGIHVKVSEEAYTSKCDHLALESMQHHETYLGKRIKRGLFQSSTHKLINADVNGSIGIGRKVFGNSVVKQIADSGLAFSPVKLTI